MKKLFYAFASFAVIAAGLTSCSSKDDEPGGDNNQGSGTMETMTPEESKEFLEENVTTALNMWNPEDQKEVIQFCGYFVDEYGDLELPENFFIEEDDYRSTKALFEELQKGVASANASLITRAAIDYIYDIDFQNFKGIYEPGTYEWEKVDDSNDVIFRFKNSSGQTCEIKAVGSSNSYSTSMQWTEEYYYGDDEVTQLNFKIPGEVTLTVTSNGKELLNAKMVSNVNFESHNFNVNTVVKVANISANAQTVGNDSKVTENCTLYLNDVKYMTSSAYLEGNHLFDIQYWNEYYNRHEEEKRFNEMFKKGEGTVTLLDKISVDVNYTWVEGLSDLFFDDDEIDSNPQKYVDILNKALRANVRYNNTTTVQASVEWKADVYEYGDYYDIVPVLKFADGTTYYFDEYFETGFSSVENLFNNLMRKYQSVIDSAF